MDINLKKEAMIAGFKLFGLPNSRMRNSANALTEAIELGINISKFKEPRDLNSGLIWNYDGVDSVSTVSDRITQDMYDALENFGCIGDFEYVFYPNDPSRKLVDYSSEPAIFLPSVIDKDGLIYTYMGEDCKIHIYEPDIGFMEASKVFLNEAIKQYEKGYYTRTEINEIYSSAVDSVIKYS